MLKPNPQPFATLLQCDLLLLQLTTKRRFGQLTEKRLSLVLRRSGLPILTQASTWHAEAINSINLAIRLEAIASRVGGHR